MVLSVSGVLLLGVTAVMFVRKDGLKASHGIIATLFGFYLAGTSLAPEIAAGGDSIAGMLSGLTF